MSDPCSFDACEDEGTERVVVTVAQAAAWALRPAMLEEVDRELQSEGPTAAIGLMFCAPHAEGVRGQQFQARAATLSTSEQRVLKALQGHAEQGGATIETLAKELRLVEGGLKKTILRMRKAGVVAKSRYRGVDSRSRKTVDKFLAVRQDADPPPVQPGLGLEEVLPDAQP